MKNNIINECNVCSGNTDTLIILNSLPLTGLYTTNPVPESASYDNSFEYCDNCGHGMLRVQLDPSTIYDKTYTHRTSKSKYAIRGVDIFLDVLDEYSIIHNRMHYDTVLDIGCSDGYLLSRVVADKKIGIDAVASSIYDDIEVITGNIEEVDISNIKPDVIFMRHTIEHIQDPVSVMRKISNSMSNDTLLVMQSPMLDILVEDMRYDHIFHQHLQYFSIFSIMKILKEVGLTCVHYKFDRYDWGSIILIARREGEESLVYHGRPTEDSILLGYDKFRSHMKLVSNIISNSLCVVGYGAAQMLPILGYHIEGFDKVNLVVDDDASKDGVYYYNMPVRVTKEFPGREATYVVTGLDSSRVINKRLIELNVNRIVNILSVL